MKVPEISKKLDELLDIILDLETGEFKNIPMEYSDEDIIAATKIMMSVLLSKAYEKWEREDLSNRIERAGRIGTNFSKFIKRYTDIDTKTLIEKVYGDL